MTNTARPYVVRYRLPDGKTGAVTLTAYDVMDAMYAAIIKLSDEKITVTGFYSIEPDQVQLERDRQQRSEAMATDFTAAVRKLIRESPNRQP